MHYILIFIHYVATLRAAGRHIHALHRSTGTAWGGIGRGDRLSRRGGSADGGLRATVAWQPSVQPFACRRVDRGCPDRPRSKRQSSGGCGSRSGRRFAFPDVLALSLRYDGLRSGSRYRGGSLVPCATY